LFEESAILREGDPSLINGLQVSPRAPWSFLGQTARATGQARADGQVPVDFWGEVRPRNLKDVRRS
jgi:hypothetical protein